MDQLMQRLNVVQNRAQSQPMSNRPPPDAHLGKPERSERLSVRPESSRIMGTPELVSQGAFHVDD